MTDPAVENAFLASWERAEAYYEWWAEKRHHEWLAPMVGFVRQLRGRGYDRIFRHGHALYFLVLSRSLEHGLRPTQPFIDFWPREDGGMTVHCQLREAGGVLQRSLELRDVALTPELDQLLDRLATEPID